MFFQQAFDLNILKRKPLKLLHPSLQLKFTRSNNRISATKSFLLLGKKGKF